MTIDAKATEAVVRVGGGRGFIIEAGHNRLVITAAHCLPHFPPAASVSYVSDRTYAEILGPLGDGETKVWAECLFADPVGDIAVLGSPDNQELYNEALAYEELTEAAPGLPVSVEPLLLKASAWLLTPDGRWTRCTVQCGGAGKTLWVEGALDGIHGGMSGSPILDDDATAIGVLCCSGGGLGKVHTGGGPNPGLPGSLPGWLLQKIAAIF